MERRRRPWIDGRFLRSRVARRVFFLVLASALVPILSFALLSFRQVTRQLERDAHARLAQDAKQLGMAVLQRLLLLDAGLAAHGPEHGAEIPPALAAGRFRGSEPLDAAGLAPADAAHLDAGGSLLRVAEDGGAPRILLLRRADTGRLLAAEVDPRFLFAPGALRANQDLEVRSEGRPLFAARRSAPDVEQRSAGWELFLRPQFRGPTWSVSLSEPQAALLAPLAQFRAVFPLVTLLSLLVVGLSTLMLVRRSLVPIDVLQAATRRIAARDFSTRVGLESGDEFEELAASFDSMAANIERHIAVVETVSSVGRALSAEQDARRLFATILRATMSVTDATAGALSLADAQDRLVRQQLLEWTSPHDEELSARLERQALEVARYGRTLHDAANGELSIPMRSHEGAVIGVLQLARAGAFDTESMALAESLASQTAVALTKQRLAGEFRALFEGLIQLIVKAIDQKSPYTGEHCRRVPILTELIADAACDAVEGPLKDFTLSESERYELRIAALLHDCGKVTTPVHVQDKSTKLETLFDKIELVDARFELARRDLELAALRERLPGGGPDAALAERLGALEADRDFVRLCNVGGESLPADAQARLREIAARWRWRGRDGAGQPILGGEELENLLVSRGTLNARERGIIEHHVVASIEMLEQLPYPRSLRNVPAIAGAHHERMDGAGYPQGLVRDQISMQGRILGLADVFEALTARDRPYKPGMPLSRALAILEEMRDEGHVDPDLFEVFVREKVYLRYAAEYLDPEQIDEALIDEVARATLEARARDREPQRPFGSRR
jgi:HD-GYP domain-containing protein (c-di-GMP phosphodiesterase class II)/HAMP domain-containing protein